MTKKTTSKPHIRLVFQRSPVLTKLIVLLALVLSMAALVTLSVTRRDIQAKTAVLDRQAQILEQKNRRLEQDIRELGTVQSVEKIAAAELGLVKPGTTVFQPENSNAD